MRITSTYVEKTFNRTPLWSSTEDHLHIRGENVWKQVFTLITIGSPPHTWRKLLTQANLTGLIGITSTYVEKTDFVKQFFIPFQDHLHIRGENIKTIQSLMCVRGSPPHTWRKRKAITVGQCCIRITSTYVEKTEQIQAQQQVYQDHLHIRGENQKFLLKNLQSLGSPPHTWRKRWNINNSCRGFRITSTYVEKTT